MPFGRQQLGQQAYSSSWLYCDQTKNKQLSIHAPKGLGTLVVHESLRHPASEQLITRLCTIFCIGPAWKQQLGTLLRYISVYARKRAWRLWSYVTQDYDDRRPFISEVGDLDLPQYILPQ